VFEGVQTRPRRHGTLRMAAWPWVVSIPAVPLEENLMSLGTILLIVLVLALVGVIPSWPHSRSWGYGPSGVLGFIVLIVVVLLVMGRL
jgi:hypothetical protein